MQNLEQSFAFFCVVHSDGRVQVSVNTEVRDNAVGTYLRTPFARRGHPAYADVPGRVVRGRSVHAVDGRRHVTQIAHPIVCADAVDVINLSSRPGPVKNKPRKSVCQILTSAQPDQEVAFFPHTTRRVANTHGVCRPRAAVQDTGVRVVGEVRTSGYSVHISSIPQKGS